MSTPPVLDLESLVNPISEENPIGTDPRLDDTPTSLYYQIKDVRNQARASERKSLMYGEDDESDWSPIVDLAPELLSTLAKDLEVGAYLTEALVRERGFAGLRDAFTLLAELVERYGDELYPLPDEDGIETRVAPLSGLNGEGGDGTLIAPIARIPITGSTSVGQFHSVDLQQAKNLDNLSSEARDQQIQEGVPELSTVMSAIHETSDQFYQHLLEDLTGASEAFERLNQACDEKYGRDAPPSSAISNAIEEVRKTLMGLVGSRITSSSPEDESPEEDEVESSAEGAPVSKGTSGSSASIASASIQNREEAFRGILRVAEFFKKTEPHSPIPFALERIVRWGRMPLPQLLKELIQDEGSIDQMFKLVGIPSTDQEATSYAQSEEPASSDDDW
ncbi:MAG TPA: type VI secretion system protein TssA [Planctomycetaceae bacterium]|nr:type VI secretion system protein TssA [Planctomycetaceae bacterium]